MRLVEGLDALQALDLGIGNCCTFYWIVDIRAEVFNDVSPPE